MIGKHQFQRRDEVGQMMQTIGTNLHVVESHTYRVGRERFLVEDWNLGIPLTEMSQQSKFGPH